MSTNATRKLLTVPEVATLLGVHRDTVYRKIQSGAIPAVRLGDGHSALRIDAKELERELYRDPEENR